VKRQLLLISIICTSLCLLLLLSNCAGGFQNVQVTDVPIVVSQPGTQGVDVDLMFETIAQRVHEKLPRAYFQGMVIFARCPDLPHLQGRFVFDFVQVRGANPWWQVVRATASVDTVHGTMDLDYFDESDHYPSTERVAFGGDHSIKQIALTAHQYIAQQGLCDGDVILTQLSDDSWDVWCRSLSDFRQKCHFEIVNGEINEKPQ